MLSRFQKRLYRTHVAWRLSGIAYRTAVSATHGRSVPKNLYIAECSKQMDFLRPYLNKDVRIVEFGSGIGGNLISISSTIHSGIGIDVNPGYARIARKLAKEFLASNLTFISYDGRRIPPLEERPSVIFSIGVFERLDKATTLNLLNQLAVLLAPDGYLAVYFLSDRARTSEFTRRLGPDAYTYWNAAESMAAVEGLATRLSVLGLEEWPVANVLLCKKGS